MATNETVMFSLAQIRGGADPLTKSNPPRPASNESVLKAIALAKGKS